MGDRVMVENPLPHRDLPLRVGIVEQAIAADDKHHIGDHADPQRQRAAHGSGVWPNIGGGQAHEFPLSFQPQSKHIGHNSR
jgi:hypothetical protein